MFLHADPMHLFGNMIFLWVFGDDVEEAMGRGRFLAFYVLSGAIGAIIFAVSDPLFPFPLIGASGAISGVVIAYAMLRPCAKVTVLVSIIPLRISAYWVVGGFVVLQFASLGSASKSEVAYWCHVGGMATGAVLFPLMRRAGVKLFECIRGPKIPAIEARVNPVAPPGDWGTR
jgi:membrane associated rhomboid family serine protease